MSTHFDKLVMKNNAFEKEKIVIVIIHKDNATSSFNRFSTHFDKLVMNLQRFRKRKDRDYNNTIGQFIPYSGIRDCYAM